MPIQHAIWQVGTQPTLLARSKLVSEQQLEETIMREPRSLCREWMLIGQPPDPLSRVRPRKSREVPKAASLNVLDLPAVA